MARTKKTAGKNVAAEAQAAARKAVSEAQAVARKVAAVEKAAETSEKAEPGTEEKETKTASTYTGNNTVNCFHVILAAPPTNQKARSCCRLKNWVSA